MKKDFFKSFKTHTIVIICLIVIILSVHNLLGKLKVPTVSTNNLISVKDSSRYINNIFEKIDTETNIVYGEATNDKGEQEKLLLDVYKPSEDKATNRPAIIWVHGGGYTSGSKDYGIEKDLAIDFAKKGYVTININYRLSQAAGTKAVKDAVSDCSAALKWLIENSEKYGVDKDHIALGGYSAGANAIINICYSNPKLYNINKKDIFAAIDLAGGSLYLENSYKDSPPCVIIQGTSDTKVSYSSSKALSDSLNEHGIYNVLHPIKGSNHDLVASYDEVSNEITKFLYKVLTGKDIEITTNKGNSNEVNKVKQRHVSGKVYNAKQVNLNIDGNLNEWGDSEIMKLDELKDVGNSMPSKDDFTGTAMIGWNEKDPTRIYIAATIIDDVIQDENDAKLKWFNDDCLEIAFDLANSDKIPPITKWVIGATGKDLSVLADKQNTEYKIVKDGNKYIYEMAINITKPESALPDANSKFKIEPQTNIGFSLSYNECENHVRQEQIGWTKGSANDRGTFGNLIFVSDKVK
jgi:acetyl esterase/lipase